MIYLYKKQNIPKKLNENFKALARVSAQATSWQRDWPLAMACPQASSTMLHELSRDTPTLSLKAQGQPLDN